MILSFQRRFVKPINEGWKQHTFRLDQHNRWKVGNSIQYYIDTRTVEMRKFHDDGECKHITPVFISIQGSNLMIFKRDLEATMIVDRGERIESWEFLRKDGFVSYEDMLQCICEIHPGKQILTGKIIHWTEFRY